MVAEWITAVATSMAAIAAIITIVISVWKVMLKKRKDRNEIARRLVRTMQWFNKTKILMEKILLLLIII